MQDPGALVREVRRELGLSQRRLALRAGTTQARVSRIENGLESPSFASFSRLLGVMGRRPVVDVRPVEAPATLLDRSGTPAERLREAASWNLLATRLELAGQAARRAGHPSTRRTRP